MKKSLKLSLTAAAVLTVTAAFAGHVTQPLHHKLMTKTAAKPSGIIIGADWMFLRPSNFASKFGSFTAGPRNSAYNSKYGLQGAFHLYTGYGNVEHGTSVQLAWTHLQTSRTRQSFGNVSPFGIGNSTTGAFTGTSSYKYDAVDLTLTKAMEAVGKLNWQMFVGVRYAEINHGLTSGVLRTALHSNYSTSFRGFGPRLGINGNYELCHGVKLFGQVAVSLLYSELKDNYTSYTGPTVYSGNTLDRQGITPNIDAQLGLSYDHPFHGAIVGVRAGYQVDYYHDATANLTNASTASSVVDNVSFSGPFVGLVVHG